MCVCVCVSGGGTICWFFLTTLLSIRGLRWLGHVHPGISRAAGSSLTGAPRTNNDERHAEPRLRRLVGSRPLDLSQPRGLPAGCGLLLRPPECGHGEVNRETLLHPHHSIQDLQVLSLVCGCLSPEELFVLKSLFILRLPSAYRSIHRRSCPAG